MCVHVCVCARALKSECECVGELGAAVSGNSLRRRSVSFSQTHTHIKKKQHHLEHACTSAHTLALGAYLLLLCLSVSRFPRLSPPIPPPTLTHTHKSTQTPQHIYTHKHTNIYLVICLASASAHRILRWHSAFFPPCLLLTPQQASLHMCVHICVRVCVYLECVLCVNVLRGVLLFHWLAGM